MSMSLRFSSSASVSFARAFSSRARHSVSDFGAGVTKQSFKDLCDVNRIMSRFTRTGIFDHTSQSQQYYSEVVPFDLQASLNQVIAAEAAFAGLPAQVRKRMQNSPVELMTFLSDPNNRDEALKLGLLKAPEEPVVASPQPAPPEPDKAA